MFPEDMNRYDLYHIGSDLLVNPVTEAEVTDSPIYLADEHQVYYNHFTHRVHRGTAAGKSVAVPLLAVEAPSFLRTNVQGEHFP